MIILFINKISIQNIITMVNFYNQQNKNINPSLDEDDKQLSVSTKSMEKNTFNKYIDPTGEFDAGQFKLSILYVQNKLLLYRLLIGVLVIFSASTIIFSLWRGFEILMFDLTTKPYMERDLTMFVDYTALQPHFRPFPIEIMTTYILPGGTDKNDIVSELINPNDKHMVYFEYYYDFNGNYTDRKSGFLLPGENRLLVAYGLDTSVYGGSAVLRIENLRFQRINPHEVSDVGLWREERVDFSVSNFTYSFAGEEGQHAHAVRFTITNNSAYGYRYAEFVVGLYQNSGLVGVMPLMLRDFEAGESRQIDLRNFVGNLSVTGIQVYPIIDLTDKAVYLAPRGQIRF